MLHWVFRILVWMFLVGMVGSMIVVCITTVEDLFVLFERDEPAPGLNSETKNTAPAQQQPVAE